VDAAFKALLRDRIMQRRRRGDAHGIDLAEDVPVVRHRAATGFGGDLLTVAGARIDDGDQLSCGQ